MLKLSYKNSCVKFDTFSRRNGTLFSLKNEALRSESVKINQYSIVFINLIIIMWHCTVCTRTVLFLYKIRYFNIIKNATFIIFGIKQFTSLFLYHLILSMSNIVYLLNFKFIWHVILLQVLTNIKKKPNGLLTIFLKFMQIRLPLTPQLSNDTSTSIALGEIQFGNIRSYYVYCAIGIQLFLFYLTASFFVFFGIVLSCFVFFVLAFLVLSFIT